MEIMRSQEGEIDVEDLKLRLSGSLLKAMEIFIRKIESWRANVDGSGMEE
jgi:hypothetical protein